MIPIFDTVDQAADYVKFHCTTAPQLFRIDGKLMKVWGDGYAEDFSPLEVGNG